MPKEHCVTLLHSLFFKLLCDPIGNNFQRQLVIFGEPYKIDIFLGQNGGYWQFYIIPSND